MQKNNLKIKNQYVHEQITYNTTFDKTAFCQQRKMQINWRVPPGDDVRITESQSLIYNLKLTTPFFSDILRCGFILKVCKTLFFAVP